MCGGSSPPEVAEGTDVPPADPPLSSATLGGAWKVAVHWGPRDASRGSG